MPANRTSDYLSLVQVVTIFYELDLMPKVLIAGLPAEPSAYQRVGAPTSICVVLRLASVQARSPK